MQTNGSQSYELRRQDETLEHEDTEFVHVVAAVVADVLEGTAEFDKHSRAAGTLTKQRESWHTRRQDSRESHARSHVQIQKDTAALQR